MESIRSATGLRGFRREAWARVSFTSSAPAAWIGTASAAVDLSRAGAAPENATPGSLLSAGGRDSGRVGALGGVAEVLQEQQAGHAHQRQGRAALVVTGELDRAGCGKVLGPGESHRGGTL